VDHRILKLVQPLAEKHIERSISDPELRIKVTPKYTLGCKRILLSNDYYPALNRRNVTVIDEGVTSITPKGIKTADGVEHEFDCIVLATGFQAAESAIPFPVIGLGGKDINEVWKDTGPEAYLGTVVNGFPNNFMIIGPNTGLGHSSMILMIEHQVHYILEYMKAEKKQDVKYFDVKKEVQDNYNAAIQKRLNKAVWGDQGGCASWYKTASGKNTTLWPGFTFEFKAKTWFFNQQDYQMVKNDPSTENKSPEMVKEKELVG
jgi:cation diffusion facilitator CzcD-associated flavoprotein CzcO